MWKSPREKAVEATCLQDARPAHFLSKNESIFHIIGDHPLWFIMVIIHRFCMRCGGLSFVLPLGSSPWKPLGTDLPLFGIVLFDDDFKYRHNSFTKYKTLK